MSSPTRSAGRGTVSLVFGAILLVVGGLLSLFLAALIAVSVLYDEPMVSVYSVASSTGPLLLGVGLALSYLGHARSSARVSASIAPAAALPQPARSTLPKTAAVATAGVTLGVALVVVAAILIGLFLVLAFVALIAIWLLSCVSANVPCL